MGRQSIPLQNMSPFNHKMMKLVAKSFRLLHGAHNCLFRILKTATARAWKKEEEKRLEWQLLNEEVIKLTKELKGIVIDDRFFEGEHEEKQMTIPWLDETIQSQRKDLGAVLDKREKLS